MSLETVTTGNEDNPATRAQQPVNLASLPAYVVIVIDGIRFDAKKVVEQLKTREARHVIQATPHSETLTYVNQTSLAGQRTILLEDLVANGWLYLDDTRYDARLAEHELMRYQHILEPAATPVDLGRIPAETVILMDNIKVKAGKLYKLLVRNENKGWILPNRQPKFNFDVIDTAEDRGIHGSTAIEALRAADVYWFNGQEFDADEIERLILLNVRKLDPRNPHQRLTDSVKASWQSFTADAKATHKKYPKSTSFVLWAMAAFLLLDAIHNVGTPSNVVTLNLLHYLQDPANGFTAYNEILKGVSTQRQFTTINLAFTVIGGWLGYHDFRGTRKYSGLIGAIVGILVSRVVQFLVVVAIAAMMH